MTTPRPTESRRDFLRLMTAVPFVLGAPTILLPRKSAPGPVLLSPTPFCGDDDDDDPTPAQTEGPYFTPNSPERASLLEPGLTGTALLIAGGVYTRSCRPIEGALLDFWQADPGGEYDNTGFTLRGHQFAGGDGRFSLETLRPGLYPGRTRHLHVKVQGAVVLRMIRENCRAAGPPALVDSV